MSSQSGSSELSSAAQALKSRRARIAFIIAAVEGLLILVGFINHGWWLVVILAILAVGFWFASGRSSKSSLTRQASWILAVSQTLVVLVPVLFAIAKGIAIGVVVVIAVIALIVLFTERRNN